MSLFKNRKLAKQLASIGSHVETVYMVYINNNEPVTFSSKDECKSFIQSYRDSNVIFKLQIFRIETYSL